MSYTDFIPIYDPALQAESAIEAHHFAALDLETSPPAIVMANLDLIEEDAKRIAELIRRMRDRP